MKQDSGPDQVAIPAYVYLMCGIKTKTMQKEHSVLYGVWKNREIIGDASLSGFSRRMSHRAEFGISVVKSEWGQGIGSALLQKCIMYAKEHAIELINLEVRSDNIRAIHVYEKYGFRKIGT